MFNCHITSLQKYAKEIRNEASEESEACDTSETSEVREANDVKGKEGRKEGNMIKWAIVGSAYYLIYCIINTLLYL